MSIFNQGDYFAYKQTINISTDLPYGIDFDYMGIVQPFGLLRTWISSTQGRNAPVHLINLVVTYSLGGNLLHSQSLSTTFKEPAGESDDTEYTLFLGQLQGFDTVE
jgi:hypothetical protein